mmetsp:Transcript_68819/g.107736  ORF Transcript_68819/g.107736 Transcript_68819/m.107736 type:complete len:309 (+) Transcript_68819:133-1059(+)|eukprot:CAMPEP_0169182814 /NCGR_PEP_ID=MMETSP1016-20121227/280_1 /TAXON_ID=342587 /ORGANISM="Karlodinium micrum, Strain CCMP2283" /LENGTH=308 /DNA_ID=CAMNT_0009258109 /DNA_START=36 /DNA_END=962 /DNA_ORIENTATION=-
MEQSLKHFHPSRRTLSRPQLELVRCYEFTTYGQHREVKVDRTYHAFRVYVDDNAVATAECELEEMLLPIEIDVQGGPPLQGLLSAHTLSVNEFIIEPRWTQEHGDIPDMAILEVAECQPGAPSEIRIPSARSQAKSSWEEQAEQQAIPPATSYQHVQMPDDPLADTRLKYGAVAFPEGEFALARAELVGDGFGALIEPSLRRTSARSPQVQVGHLRLVPTDDTRPFEDAQQIPEFVHPRDKANASSWIWCGAGGSKQHPREQRWATKTDEELGCPCCRPGAVEVERQPISKMWHNYCLELGQELFSES